MLKRVPRLALITVLAATTASAQAPPAPSADRSSSTFEVAAIKPSNPDPSNPLSMVPLAMPRPGGRFTTTNVPLKMLISLAFETPDSRIAGGPPELMSAKFDITAKTPDGVTLGQKEMMPFVKNLLIERFKMKVHTEPREMQIYDLVIARSDGRLGPDIKPSTSDCSKTDEISAQRADAMAKGDFSAVVVTKPGQVVPCTLAPNLSAGPLNISVHGDGQEIKQLIELLTPMTGRYDFDMKLDLQALLAMARGMGMNVPAGAAANLPQADGSSLMTALNEQLGLKLDSVRAAVDVLVIDTVEAPAPD